MPTEDQIIEQIGARKSPPALQQRIFALIHTGLQDELAHASFDGPPQGDCRAVTTNDLGGKLLRIGQTINLVAKEAVGLPSSGGPVSQAAQAGISQAPGGSFIVSVFNDGLLLAVFGAIYAHHKKQVARERHFSCAGVNAVNESFKVIEEAIQNGTITPQQGIAALDGIWNDWNIQIIGPAKAQGVFQLTAGKCDALCFINFEVAAIIVKKKDRYTSLASNSILGAIRSIRKIFTKDFFEILINALREGGLNETSQTLGYNFQQTPRTPPKSLPQNTNPATVSIIPPSYREAYAGAS